MLAGRQLECSIMFCVPVRELNTFFDLRAGIIPGAENGVGEGDCGVTKIHRSKVY